MFSLKTYMVYGIFAKEIELFLSLLLLLLLLFSLLFLLLNDKDSMLWKKCRPWDLFAICWECSTDFGSSARHGRNDKLREKTWGRTQYPQGSIRALDTWLRVPASSEQKEVVTNVSLCSLVLTLVSSAYTCAAGPSSGTGPFPPWVRATSSELTPLWSVHSPKALQQLGHIYQNRKMGHLTTLS